MNLRRFRNKRPYKILNSRGDVIFSPLYFADSFSSRFMGLMFVPLPNLPWGIILKPCNAIHTIGMRFNLDVFFLDDDNQVLEIRRDVTPWLLCRNKKARSVLECPAGNIPLNEINIGSRIIFKDFF